MIAKLPIISSSARLGELLESIAHSRDGNALNDFSSLLSGFMGSSRLYLMNSGISSFYIVLEALNKISRRSEVILPAYTAGSLVVAVRKAGLKPVLCDITLDDFNLDEKLLKHAVSSDTLAVVGVHMFGINMKSISDLRSKVPEGIFLIEDCCQSMGSRTDGTRCGNFGDAAFFSFNRGKNFPLYGGGAITTNNERIAANIEEEIRALPESGEADKILASVKMLAFSVAADPLIYGLGFSVISRFKETTPPKDFTVKKMDSLRAALGALLMKRCDDIFMKRRENGIALVEGLSGVEGMILPKIPQSADYVFNRLPVLFKEIDDRVAAESMLWKGGIEASRMYRLPLHRMFDLGYAKGDFPNAEYLSERLLTLPVHPGAGNADIARMVKIIKEALE